MDFSQFNNNDNGNTGIVGQLNSQTKDQMPLPGDAASNACENLKHQTTQTKNYSKRYSVSDKMLQITSRSIIDEFPLKLKADNILQSPEKENSYKVQRDLNRNPENRKSLGCRLSKASENSLISFQKERKDEDLQSESWATILTMKVSEKFDQKDCTHAEQTIESITDLVTSIDITHDGLDSTVSLPHIKLTHPELGSGINVSKIYSACENDHLYDTDRDREYTEGLYNELPLINMENFDNQLQPAVTSSVLLYSTTSHIAADTSIELLNTHEASTAETLYQNLTQYFYMSKYWNLVSLAYQNQTNEPEAVQSYLPVSYQHYFEYVACRHQSLGEPLPACNQILAAMLYVPEWVFNQRYHLPPVYRILLNPTYTSDQYLCYRSHSLDPFLQCLYGNADNIPNINDYIFHYNNGNLRFSVITGRVIIDENDTFCLGHYCTVGANFQQNKVKGEEYLPRVSQGH